MSWKRRSMDEHRVSLLGDAWRRHRDPLRSPDPKVREVVGALAGLPVAPEPRPEFRAELRAQLVAVTPRLVAEGEPTPAAAAPTATPAAAEAAAAERPAARRRLRLVKPLIAVACVLGAFVLLLGGAVLISQHALPGDALYGIKRAGEDTEYSLAGGAVDRGKLKLEFAARRIGEVADLLPRATSMAAGSGVLADGAPNADTARLVRETLDSADGDIRTASVLLGTSAVDTGEHSPLDAIISWAPPQLRAMDGIIKRIPAGSLRRRAAATRQVISDAQRRATALGADLSCTCLQQTTRDTFGPKPCAPCSSTAPAHRHHQKQPARRHPRSGSPSSRSVRPGGTAPVGSAVPSRPEPANTKSPAPPGGHASPSAPTSVPPAPSGAVATPGVPLPTIPGLIGGSSGSGAGGGVSLPVSVSSSCAKVSAGPIQIGLGNC